jgi:hypothetical protein
MTKDQATELESEKIFGNMRSELRPKDIRHYRELVKYLKRHQLNNLSDHYGSTPDDWCPPILDRRPIKDLITQISKKVEENISPKYLPLAIRSFSEEFLNENSNNRSKAILELRSRKCLLIIDALSLFHPILRERLEHSGFASGIGSNVLIIAIPPISFHVLPIYKYLEQEYQEFMSLVFRDYSEELTNNCEFGIGNVYSLKRWLVSAIDHIATNPTAPDPETARSMDEVVPKNTKIMNALFRRS